MAQTPYTTAARVTRLVGTLGIDLREDDGADDDEKAQYLADAIDQGSSDLDFYLARYAEADIAASEWCAANATWFAVRALCLRRLNEQPEGVRLECERREQLLMLVLQGKVRPPRLPNSRRAATVTNSTVDLRKFNNQVEVDRSRSTGVARDYRRNTDQNAPDDRT